MEKTILVLGQGGMSGVFGGGIVTGLQKANIYDNIEAIYGLSCGALNGAYFLAEQSELGSSIYYEDLTKDFVKLINIPFGIFYRLKNKIIGGNIPKNQKVSAVDIGYLFSIIENKKKLNLQKFLSGKIPLYVRVTNTQNGETKDIDLRTHKDPMSLLKASVSMIPMAYGVKIAKDKNSAYYVDGAIKHPFIFGDFPKNLGDKRMVIVLNRGLNHNFFAYFKDELVSFLSAIFSKLMYPHPTFFDWMKKEIEKNIEIKALQSNPNVLLIVPPKHSVKLLGTNKKEIVESYNLGIEASKKIVEFMKEGNKKKFQ